RLEQNTADYKDVSRLGPTLVIRVIDLEHSLLAGESAHQGLTDGSGCRHDDAGPRLVHFVVVRLRTAPSRNGINLAQLHVNAAHAIDKCVVGFRPHSPVKGSDDSVPSSADAQAGCVEFVTYIAAKYEN